MFNSILLCFLSGCLLFVSSPTVGFWPLVFIALVPLLFASEKLASVKSISFGRLYLLGCIVGFILSVTCFYWVANMSWLAMFAIATGYSLVYSFFVSGIVFGIRAGLQQSVLLLWIVTLWTSLEIILSDIFLSIPSISLGYFIWPFGAAIQLADITGVVGLGMWVAAINVMLFGFIKDGLKKNQVFYCLTIFSTCCLISYGHIKIHTQFEDTDRLFTVNTIFTSILSEDKKNKDLRVEFFEILKKETIESINTSDKHPDLIIWPETSFPVVLRSVHDKKFLMELLALTQEKKVPILVGARSIERGEDKLIKKYNSAFLIPERGFVSQEYRKNILVPFTEKKYFRKHSKTTQNAIEPNFNAGVSSGIINIFNKFKFGVVICYEIFFPDFVRKSLSKNSGFLVNITNDRPAFENLEAAYNIPLSHLVYRAVENRKYLIRSANWGFSAVISPKGEILESSTIGSTGYLSTNIMPNYNETFFSKNGFIFARIILFITAIFAIGLCLKLYCKKLS